MKIIVSDHAINRYLERVRGINSEEITEELRKEIESIVLTEGLKRQIEVLGDGKYPIGEGHRVVVKEDTIVSVL